MFKTQQMGGMPTGFETDTPFELLTPPSKTTSKEYEHLFEISDQLRKEMANKSLGLIMLECTLMSLKLNREGNKLTLVFKRESTDIMTKIIIFKIESYNQIVKDIVVPTLEGFGTLLGLHGGAVEVFSRAWSVALRGADNQLSSAHSADLAGIDHLYKTEGDINSQYRESRQEYHQNFEAIVRLFEQFLQQIQETFRTVANGG